MAEINLLQGDGRTKGRLHVPEMPRGSGKALLWVLAGLVALELGAWGILFSYKGRATSQVLEAESQMQDITTKIRAFEKDANQAILAQAALQSFTSLLDKHLYWTKLWTELGKSAYKRAQYLSLQATIDNSQFSLRGVTPTYTDLGKVILALEQSDGFSRVDLISTGAGEGDKVEVKFEILVTLKPEVLQRADAQLQQSTTTRP
ncbi:MAG: hypothetical protein A2722_04180 [Candidatus Doudnabacteria bacterium RIFCSPHIGHO2_01_FULL_50_11]|uniref:PilN domain-containing protein n=1 Tax=Candidatus Doudnabacteria bacterium RIFCSPHIGHO2_01_FULL_50_11 TaxID=1817828 RepID=A0A1F5PFG5_9BACT|nr:MAG: hypothetical protein A2722_04180 [Candidatus Doudnabacteria bacterium RIFCSPHIGHO2_01_FULL_50_11]HLC44887.1 hypothetical protein [Patescibacteria group bacterium]